MDNKPLIIAPLLRRVTAHLIDLVLIVFVLAIFSLFLPVAPPPLDAMAFYVEQDFKNYFTLVGAWVAIATIVYLLAMSGAIYSTPGMRLVGLRYMGLDGSNPTPLGIGKRFIGAILYSLVVLLPGPVIALLVAVMTHTIFSTPLTTAAKMLDKVGVPDLAQLAIHSLSFIALLVGFVYVYKQISHKSENTHDLTPSWYDKKCGCTIALR